MLERRNFLVWIREYHVEKKGDIIILYLSETYGFGVAEIGLYAWVPYVGAMFGAWFGGLLAQNRIKSGWTVNKSRKFVIALGGLIMLRT